MSVGFPGIIAAAGSSSFAYDDIPNQLLRIDHTSLAGSGGVLTGVTDASSYC